ncbi:MAG TPA: MoxR family ATPase [Dehalococcoidia bacterium]|nr:MoxR family ATPase [Dehalococcoidia bacterium]
MSRFESIEDVTERLAAVDYIADRELATTVFLAQALEKPLLLEGEAGVGKTELAKALAESLGARLIRLQCYEGIDSSQALYEWNYPRQLLHIRLADGDTPEGEAGNRAALEQELFSESYLVRRPLLDAILADDDVPPVLLIDEVDRADEEFEAFLLEVLSDFQITVPELGTLTARQRPLVLLTSNRTRELHDALKRRCLYLWLSYPDFDREYDILRTRVPGIDEHLAAQVCGFMQLLRDRDFYKKPGVAETIDWGLALMALHRDELDEATVTETVGCIFKYHDDIERFTTDNLVAVLDQVDINRSL